MSVWNGMMHTGGRGQAQPPERLEANDQTHEQKKVRLKQFLKILSEDPALASDQGFCPELKAELMRQIGITDEPVDMARMVTASLNRIGIKACHEEMQDYVLRGGTIDGFISVKGQMAN